MRIADIIIQRKLGGGGGDGDPSQGATATAADITLGKTAAANGEMLTGTLEPPELDSKTITANGTYAASSDNLDGYSEVTVNTDPTKGIVFSDFDSDGYPHKAKIIGYIVVPELYLDGLFRSNVATFLKKVTELTLAESVIEVGGSAIRYCDMADVKFLGDVTSLNSNCFGSSHVGTYDFTHCTDVPSIATSGSLGYLDNTTIKVPQSLLAEWQSATNWAAMTDATWVGV